MRPDPDGLPDLPAGFSYRIVSVAGEAMPGGGITPDRFDGNGSFPGADGATWFVRNHEQGSSATYPAVADPALTYDPAAKGGTTTLRLDAEGNLVEEYVSLAGTFNNCAGGVTPWATWLTCEETETKAGSNGQTRHHGYVFEVDPSNPANNVNPTPLEALGRFAHEAAMIDPATGVVYLTEDAGGPNGLVYRFTPSTPLGGYGSLRAGGALETMSCTDAGGSVVPDLSAYADPGVVLRLNWLPVPDPSALVAGSTRKQFAWSGNPSAPVATRSRKFEGAWWGSGAGYVVCSFARNSDGSIGQHDGQVWKLDPVAGTLTLEVRFGINPDTSSDLPDGPDNITVSPWGGLMLAEDGDGVQHLYAVSRDGFATPLARNARDDSEFTGVNFSAGGETLYANLQAPGVTFAITGPFARIRRS